MGLQEFAEGLRGVKNTENFTRLIGDSFIELEQFKSTLNELKVNEEFNLVSREGKVLGDVSKLSKAILEADAVEIAKLTGKELTSAEKVQFESLIKENPYKAVRELRERVNVLKKEHGHLDVTMEKAVEEIKSGNIKMKESIENIEKNLKSNKTLKALGAAALLFGIVEFGVEIAEVQKQRTGCFQITTVQGKTTSCKLKTFSCSYPDQAEKFCSLNGLYMSPSMMHPLIFARFVLSEDSTSKLKADFNRTLNYVPGTDVHEFVKDNYEKIKTSIPDLMKRNVITINDINLCKYTDNLDNKSPPDCVMCSTSVPKTDPNYLDISNVPGNILYQCNSKPTILETAADILKHTGVNLLEVVGDGLKSILSKIAIWAGLIIVLLLVVYFGVKQFTNK